MLRGQIAYREGEDAGRFEMSLPDDVPYRGVCLPQYESERILGEHVASFGPVVERGSELTGLSQDDEGVIATILRDGAETAVRAKYLVGCDGAHSLVRKQLGLAFEGDAFEGAYMLADVEVDCSFPPGYAIRASRRSHDGKEDGRVCIRLPGRNRYRISMVAPEELAAPKPAGGEVAHGLESGTGPELHHIQAVIDRVSHATSVAPPWRASGPPPSATHASTGGSSWPSACFRRSRCWSSPRSC